MDCDIELTQRGIQQAKDCGKKLKRLTGQRPHLFYSPYVRAKHTASIIASNFKNVPMYECPSLHERIWGELRDIVDTHQADSHHFEFNYRPGGGESFSDTYLRVSEFFNMLRANYSYYSTNKIPLIIVSHAEWIRVALMYLTSSSVKTFIDDIKNPDNCEIKHLQMSRNNIQYTYERNCFR
jgi:broad specificity phosphatase PhoE